MTVLGSTTDDLVVKPTTLDGIYNGEQRAQTLLLNNIVKAMGFMMPGILLSDPGSKKGTSSEKAWRTEACSFTFRGKRTAAAAQEKALTATTHDVAASKQAWFALSVQTDGTTFTITKAADQTVGTDVYPTIPDNEICFGFMKIVTGAGGIFDATTDDLEPSGTTTGIQTVEWFDNPGLALIGNESSVAVSA